MERLQPFVRDRRASYRQSLGALAEAKRAPRPAGLPPLYTKTSLMLGLGETEAEVLRAMRDIRAAGVDVLTLGQYLRPTVHHLAVVEYVAPERFEAYRVAALAMGFAYCAAGPLVRSSYKAGEFFIEHMLADPDSRPAPAPPRGGAEPQAKEQAKPQAERL